MFNEGGWCPLVVWLQFSGDVFSPPAKKCFCPKAWRPTLAHKNFFWNNLIVIKSRKKLVPNFTKKKNSEFQSLVSDQHPHLQLWNALWKHELVPATTNANWQTWVQLLESGPEAWQHRTDFCFNDSSVGDETLNIRSLTPFDFLFMPLFIFADYLDCFVVAPPYLLHYTVTVMQQLNVINDPCVLHVNTVDLHSYWPLRGFRKFVSFIYKC